MDPWHQMDLTGMEATLDMSSNKILQLQDPTDSKDAVTKEFMDEAVSI